MQSCECTHHSHVSVHHAVMWAYTPQSCKGTPCSHVSVYHAVMQVYTPQSCEGTPCSHASVHYAVMWAYTPLSCEHTPHSHARVHITVTLQITLQWNLNHPETLTYRYQKNFQTFTYFIMHILILTYKLGIKGSALLRFHCLFLACVHVCG